jgi:hypothetical protein
LIISFGNFSYGNQWPYFENYTGELWQWMQIAVTPPGFYLLWSKRWKLLPLSSIKITILGFFIASGITFLSLGFITVNNALIYFNFFIIGSASLIALGYSQMTKRKSNQPDEMFP